MEKIKEKLEHLKLESQQHQTAHETAVASIKDLETQLIAKEREIAALNNKVSLLAGEVERAENRADAIKSAKHEGDKQESLNEALTRKIALLESQLEEKERSLKEAVASTRQHELLSEQSARKAKQIENEKADLASKFEDLQTKYNSVKEELETTLKGLEEL